MKCNEIRNLVLAYLDSELDAKTSQEIQLHLQSCAECAQLFEREEKFNERLCRVLRAGRPTSELWEQVESRLRPKRKAVALGSVTAFVAGLVIYLMVSRSGMPSLDLAQAVEQDHREFLAGKFGPEFTGALPDNVARRLDARLDPGAFAQLPSATGFQAKGSRLCFLRGVPAAWTVGRYANTVVSLIVIKESELDHFPQAKQRLLSGDRVVCARLGGDQFAARLVGDHVVCAVASVSKQTLKDLVNSVPGPG